MNRYHVACVFFLILFAGLPAHAQVARLVHYQGVLTDADGNAFDGSTDLEFSIYRNFKSQKPVWTETHKSVPVTNGSYEVLLGGENPLKLSYYEYYLGVKIPGTDREVSRKMIVGSGYNYRISFLFAAYTIVWIAIFGYLLFISRRQKSIIRDLQQLLAYQRKQ